jgi:hypothetical protein
MRTAAAVDSLVLWLMVGILVLLWLGLAGGSLRAYVARTETSWMMQLPPCAEVTGSSCRPLQLADR